MEIVTPFLIAIICIAVITYVCNRKWLQSKYPPGPWPLPIIGNLHLLSKNIHVDLMNLARRYGPVYTVWMGSKPRVIVCNKEEINEVLNRKGIDFAGRPINSLALKILFYQNEDLVSRPYDDKAKIMRKMAMSVITGKGNDGLCLDNVLGEEIEYLIERIEKLREDAVDVYSIIKVPIANAIMRSIFSLRFENECDPAFLDYVENRLKRSAATAKALMIEMFPPLWYLFPSFRKEIYESAAKYKAFIERYFQEHEATYKEGIVRDFTDAVIKYQREQDDDLPSSQRLTKLNVMALVSNMIAGGTHTTTVAVAWCFLALLHYPNVQEKLYQELNHLLKKKNTGELAGEENNDGSTPLAFDQCDRPHLPFDLSDRPHLPYLKAFIHEILRRCTLSPLGGPHKSIVETSIGQYSIPKDTAIMCNIYASLMNEADWPKPYDIVPERFLDSNGEFDNSKAKLLMAFGAGPRSCIGQNLARKELFLCLANVLYSFELCCPSVKELPTLNDVVISLECSPKPFKLSFKLRKR